MSTNLEEIQTSFTRYLRDPLTAAKPSGIPAERIEVYQDLVFRNVQSLFAGNFPVLESITTDDDWECLIRGFIRDYRATTPHFPQLPTEFLQYLNDLANLGNNAIETRALQSRQLSVLARYPFIVELAHYEWVELDVQILPTPEFSTELAQVDATDLLELNSTSHVLAYQWPVHQIGPDYLPQETPQSPTFLVVFLNRNTEVEFMSLSPLAALLLENIEQQSAALTTHIDVLTEQYANTVPDNLAASAESLIDEMQKKGLVICRPAPRVC